MTTDRSVTDSWTTDGLSEIWADKDLLRAAAQELRHTATQGYYRGLQRPEYAYALASVLDMLESGRGPGPGSPASSTPETLPFVAGLLTAALVARTDTLDWLDRIGPRSLDLAPTVEVLAAVLALVDTAFGEPGLGNELVTSVLPY